MSDLLRFRIARAPVKSTDEGLQSLRYPNSQDKGAFSCWEPQDGPAAIHNYMKTVAYIPQSLQLDPGCYSENSIQMSTELKCLRLLSCFAAWLESKEGKASSVACLEWLADAAQDMIEESVPASIAQRLVGAEVWKSLRTSVGDSLVATIVALGGTEHAVYLTSLFRVISLVEMLASGATPDESAVRQVVTRTFILLPDWVPDMRRTLEGHSTKPFWARTPAFSDLMVVREEWSCFTAGEIAHIENVLKGEFRERSHERLEEHETREEQEATRTNYEERDTQSTNRVNLKEESEIETRFEVGVDGQVDTRGQYGPTHVETHLGAQLSYATVESRRRAMEQSREIVDRAVSKIETKVRETRSQRKLTRITEENLHRVDNTGTEAESFSGIYRWVDKIVRLQTFRYRHRFLLEFQVPDPAAFVRWLATTTPPPPINRRPPPAFTNHAEQPLSAEQLTRENYQALAARFGAAGVPAPPEDEVAVSAALELTTDTELPAHRDLPVEFAPHASGTMEVAVPHNYEAIYATVTFNANPTLVHWRDREDDSLNRYAVPTLGYHNATAAITLGGQTVKLSSFPTDTVRDKVRDRGIPYEHAWTTTMGSFPTRHLGSSYGSGKLQIAVIVGGTFNAAVSLSVHCKLQRTAFQSWQTEVFDRLLEAHQTAMDAYLDAVAATEVRQSIHVSGKSPTRNAETVREELKRQVIEMLLRERFLGRDLVSMEPDGPATRLAEAAAASREIQFFEQAFEWSNMTYILYPYYWSDSAQWPELQRIDGADHDYVRFLRSGSARVIVPARPGFEDAVLFYSIFDDVWTGGTPPIPGDPLYVSIAAEIEDLMSGPDRGEPMDMWEVKLPTTLVWLDPDARIPKRNENRQLVGVPLIDLCS